MAFISNGTTILDNGAFQASLGSQVLISEQTASASATVDFTSGIDSTYPIYKFEFINMHPSNNNINFQFNMSSDGGSTYAVTKTSTAFGAYHDEIFEDSLLTYDTSKDLAQSTGSQPFFILPTSSDNDHASNGELILFNPSSTTFVKHFIARTASTSASDYSVDSYVAGYGNTTSAVDAVRFQMSSGNIDAGTIKLYGIKDS